MSPGKLLALFGLPLILSGSPSSACALVMVSDEGRAMAGRNEDSNIPLHLTGS